MIPHTCECCGLRYYTTAPDAKCPLCSGTDLLAAILDHHGLRDEVRHG